MGVCGEEEIIFNQYIEYCQIDSVTRSFSQIFLWSKSIELVVPQYIVAKNKHRMMSHM